MRAIMMTAIALSAVHGVADAQRRAGAQLGPVTWQLTAAPTLCLSGEDGWGVGSSVRVNPCGAAMVNNQAIIYDAEFNFLRSAANPAMCLVVNVPRAGEALGVGTCDRAADANRAWSFTRAGGIWLRDNDGLCLRPEGGAGGRVLLAPCRGGPANTWSCTAVASWPTPIDGGRPAERVQEWCDR